MNSLLRRVWINRFHVKKDQSRQELLSAEPTEPILSVVVIVLSDWLFKLGSVLKDKKTDHHRSLVLSLANTRGGVIFSIAQTWERIASVCI